MEPGSKEWEAVFKMASPELQQRMLGDAKSAGKPQNQHNDFSDMFGANNPFANMDGMGGFGDLFKNAMGKK
jgi:hypothetical protein